MTFHFNGFMFCHWINLTIPKAERSKEYQCVKSNEDTKGLTIILCKKFLRVKLKQVRAWCVIQDKLIPVWVNPGSRLCYQPKISKQNEWNQGLLIPNVVPGQKFCLVLKLIQVSCMKAHTSTQCGPTFEKNLWLILTCTCKSLQQQQYLMF